MTPGAEGGDRSARPPRRGPRGGEAQAERSPFQSDRRRVRRLQNRQRDTTHGPAHCVIKERLLQVALESESGQTEVHERRLWKRARRKRAIPTGTAERTARHVFRYRKRLELPRKPCCSCGETPGVAPCSAWPFREPAPGVLLAAKEQSTVDVLSALFPEKAGYDLYWIFTDAIDDMSHTILTCSKCRKHLRSKAVPKFSKRNGFDMFDNYPEEPVDLNPLEIALLSIVIPTNRIFRRNGYQQFHGIGQTVTYWNSTQTAVDSVPRSTREPHIILVRDEHGPACVPDAPIRHSRLLAAMRFLKKENRHYDHIRTDEVALADLCRSESPFILEDDALDDRGRATSEETLEEGPAFGKKGTPAMSIREEYTVPADETDDSMESPSVPANVFLVDSADKKSLRDIALEAFAGVNYPMATEPGHDRDHGSGP